MASIIPDTALARVAAQHLLREMERIAEPTEEQRRFIGSLKKAAGIATNNEKRKGKAK